MPPQREKLGWGAPLLCLGLTLVLPASLLAFPRSGTVAVLTAPGTDLAAAIGIVSRAEGSVLRADGSRRLLFAHSDRADFTSRLYAAGAWLVLNPILAGGCDPNPATRSASTLQDRPPA